MSRSKWSYRDWSDENHKLYAKVFVVFSVTCLLFGGFAVAINIYYGSETIMYKEGVTGWTQHTFDVNTEHVVLALEGDSHYDMFNVEYTLFDVTTGRMVGNGTIEVYDDDYEDYWTEVYHHVMYPGRYNLTFVQMSDGTGTFSFFVNETDLGPKEESRLLIFSLLGLFGLMGLGPLLFMIVGWRMDKHLELYGNAPTFAIITVISLFVPIILLMFI